jgi:1-acyl-sn-glycerol-3-phosphate acyltransferase
MSLRSKRVARRDDPVALRSPRLCDFFARVMARQMRTSFDAVRLARPGLPDLPDDRPLMIYSNHPSWWDPAFFMVLMPRLFPGREGYGPIDAEMLERYRFMRRIGIFGVRQTGRHAVSDFLRPALHIVSRPERMLWITAQGTFSDPRARPVDLRGGAAMLLARAPSVVAVPLAIEYPFWTEKRPEALALFGEPVEAGGSREAVGARLAAALEAAMDRLGALAVARDAAAFERVLDGREGVGGIYGAWSRLRALAGGRRHSSRHMEET